MIYLDNPATTKRKPLSVVTSLTKNTLLNSVNAGRGGHKYSIKGAKIVTDTADKLAKLFKISAPERIAFTQNATLALNMAINGILSQGGHAIVTSMEHNSVLRPVNKLGNYTVVYADNEGYVNPEDIKAAIKDDTKLIVCTHASNVSGSIQPIAEIGKIARANGLIFLVDAAQSAGTVDIDVDAMCIDLLAFSGHKSLLGPLGTGGLYVGERARLEPYITGGTGSLSKSLTQPLTLPDMLHSGTLNTPAIAALGRAVDFILKKGSSKILAHERLLAENLINRLDSIDGVSVLGGRDMNKRNGTVAFTVDGMPSEEVSRILAVQYDIATRGGWHCAYLAHKTLGTARHGAVRAGFSYYNSMYDVRALSYAISDIVKNLRAVHF
ncbi:MAG: aminotransferase class V-fold PLP-dependent enzyme [Clostridia bacterium]|nr:aminotransferase class V-fold PLP-dependent enzyme [Clostridia bacterium]